MKLPCPTCHRLGTVPKTYPAGAMIGYCGPSGETVPHETCQTCNGSGWIEDGRHAKSVDAIGSDKCQINLP